MTAALLLICSLLFSPAAGQDAGLTTGLTAGQAASAAETKNLGKVSAADEDRQYAGLDSLLRQFWVSLEMEDVDVKNGEMDFVIGTCRDSLARQHVALAVFDHYRDSRVMGEEAVAIHVYDTWFATSKVSFQGELDAMDAEIFVKFNRNSQIGMDAPEVKMYKSCGGTLEMPARGCTALLFFYDTRCAKCRLEAAVLPSVLKDVDFRMNLYAVYTGVDKKSWKEFRTGLRVKNPNVKVHHLWDPEMDSDYQLQYGVYGTPRVLLVEPDGMIIGRRLEMESLAELLGVAGAIQKTREKL